MSNISIEQALEVLAEHAYIQRKYRHNELFQRRNTMVEQVGVEYTAIGGGETPAVVHIPISYDFISFSRWDFKIIISPNGDTPPSKMQMFIEGIDITPYFKAQCHGWWCNGYGMFPNRKMSNYDVLKATEFMSKKEADKILDAGYKTIKMFGDKPFSMTLVHNIKYNHSNL